MTAITNPYLLVEIKSDSTETYNMDIKLRCYKQLESVQYMMYVTQHQPYVSVYTKNGDNHHWFNDDYDWLDMVVRLGNAELPMKEIYHKIPLVEKNNQE